MGADGTIMVNAAGTATITATLGEGENAIADMGSIIIESSGDFDFAPDPPARDPEDVVSLFSDAYETIPVSRYNSFFEPFQTTLGGVVPVVGQEIISYTNLNFVGIVFNGVIFPTEAVPTVDATDFTHFHIDINVREEVQSTDVLLLEFTNYGASGNTVGGYTIRGSELQSDAWVGFDIPLDDFAGLSSRADIGLLLFNSQSGTTPTISDIYLDNIYFYKE